MNQYGSEYLTSPGDAEHLSYSLDVLSTFRNTYIKNEIGEPAFYAIEAENALAEQLSGLANEDMHIANQNLLAEIRERSGERFQNAMSIEDAEERERILTEISHDDIAEYLHAAYGNTSQEEDNYFIARGDAERIIDDRFGDVEGWEIFAVDEFQSLDLIKDSGEGFYPATRVIITNQNGSLSRKSFIMVERGTVLYIDPDEESLFIDGVNLDDLQHKAIRRLEKVAEDLKPYI